MIELALHEGEGPLLLREVAEAQALSPKYLEQITIPLRRAGLLEAERGPRGGYRLARPAAEISAREILETIEGPIDLLECVRKPTTCGRASSCGGRILWEKLSRAMAAILSETTLADLRDELQAARAEQVPCYQI